MVKRLPLFLVIAAGLLIVATASGCSSGPSSPAQSPSAKGDVRIQASTVSAAYAKHRAASDRLYKGQRLDVTGVIVEVGTDPLLEAPEVMLSGGAGGAPRVDCIFDTKYGSQVAKLKKGQTVTVLGTCDGYAVNVLLLHCQPSGL